MELEPIIIDGKSGQVAYLNDELEMVERDVATCARVVFDDKTSAFFVLNGSPRYARRHRRETVVHTAADVHLDKLRTTIMHAFMTGRHAVSKKKLREAIARNSIDAVSKTLVVAADTVQETLAEILPKTLVNVVISGGQAGLDILQRQMRSASESEFRTAFIRKRFDAADPIVVEWARKHGAELAKDLSDTTRHNIADALVRAFENQDLRTLYDDVLNAVGDEKRATLIARTEVMRAANAGQRESWRQAVDSGMLTGDEKRQWIVTNDERLCPECESLDGEVAELGGEYPDPGGEGPPLHPNCRCTEGIIYAA